ncbi:MAG TPA: GMC family oxidoreductase [Candidatus Binataceae bacterium]|nr:GMC family oxidoreductase [Candidatus Binataceae bacterium]
MPSITRRKFLGQSALALAAASQLPSLLGCGGSSTVSQAIGAYDAIIVGGGTAGTIVAAKLQMASGGRRRILIIEAGGPTAASIGGTAFPPWLPAGRTDLTMFDVPGEYSQMAFQPFGAPYQLAETKFTYQGIGLGGNSMFNGMLFQTNPTAVFDTGWPAGWHWTDIEPYFERIRLRVPVSNTPSTDGVPQNTGPAQIVHPLYAKAGWVEGDTSRQFTVPGIYSRPYVATIDGRRAGPISGYFQAVDPGGTPVPGLEILRYSKADKIDFDSSGQAVAVHYVNRGGLDQSRVGTPGAAMLKPGGLVIMASGALAGSRLLLLSGVGPSGREAEIFPDGSGVTFSIDNPLVGVGVFDHVMTMVTYTYSGPVPYQAYNYGNYAANAADLDHYLSSGSGPYAQYQPVSILNYNLASDIPNIEIFLNPNGAGAPGSIYYGPRTFSAFLMLLNPQARGLIQLDSGGNVKYPNIYLPNTPDGAADIDLMTQAVFNMIHLFKSDPGLKIVFGPGGLSHPHLDPNNISDIRTYVTGPSPVDGVYFNRLIINHFGGTAKLSDGPGGVDPATLILRGTTNVAVVDASLIPTIVTAHPVGTIMAVADRAGDILAQRWS